MYIVISYLMYNNLKLIIGLIFIKLMICSKDLGLEPISLLKPSEIKNLYNKLKSAPNSPIIAKITKNGVESSSAICKALIELADNAYQVYLYNLEIWENNNLIKLKKEFIKAFIEKLNIKNEINTSHLSNQILYAEKTVLSNRASLYLESEYTNLLTPSRNIKEFLKYITILSIGFIKPIGFLWKKKDCINVTTSFEIKNGEQQFNKYINLFTQLNILNIWIQSPHKLFHNIPAKNFKSLKNLEYIKIIIANNSWGCLELPASLSECQNLKTIFIKQPPDWPGGFIKVPKELSKIAIDTDLNLRPLIFE